MTLERGNYDLNGRPAQGYFGWGDHNIGRGFAMAHAAGFAKFDLVVPLGSFDRFVQLSINIFAALLPAAGFAADEDAGWFLGPEAVELAFKPGDFNAGRLQSGDCNFGVPDREVCLDYPLGDQSVAGLNVLGEKTRFALGEVDLLDSADLKSAAGLDRLWDRLAQGFVDLNDRQGVFDLKNEALRASGTGFTLV
jgi:hypothetical protein